MVNSAISVYISFAFFLFFALTADAPSKESLLALGQVLILLMITTDT